MITHRRALPSATRIILWLAVGPALVLLPGWSVVFDSKENRVVHHCAMCRSFWNGGSDSTLVTIIGLLLTLVAVGAAWRARARILAESTASEAG